MPYFSRKMISAKTRYETYNGEILAIVKGLKTWWYYLKGYKYEVLIFTDDNNLFRFMDTKSLSSSQVRWAQELSWYYFQIDYYQRKANGAANALFCFLQRNQVKKDTLQTKKTRILRKLLSSLINASFLDLSTQANLLPLYWVLICGTHALFQLYQLRDMLQAKLNDEESYKVSNGAMRLRLQELQKKDSEAQKSGAI